VLPEDGKLADLVLLKGRHDAREKGVCVMEAVAWLAGEQHTDHPACACPVIATFARRLNDTVDDADRQRLREFIPQLVGSKATREVEIRRGFVAADYVVRVITPLALEACGRPDLAKRLLDCAPIIDKATAIAARDVSHEVRRAAAAVDVANYAYAAAAAAYADAAAYAAYADAAAATDAVAAVAAAYATDAAAADAAAYARAGVLKENIKEARFQLLRVLLEVRA
jgi:hypothetical protein